MALVLNEEQQFLKDAASKFFQDDAPISHFREIRDSNNELGYSKELWTKMMTVDGVVGLIGETDVRIILKTSSPSSLVEWK